MEMPIIRLELEGMRQTLCAALSQHAAQMDEDIRRAVEGFCTSENLAYVVQTAAREQLKNTIEEEVQNFFRYGPGRRAVAEAVRECILKNETYTPLDEVGEE